MADAELDGGPHPVGQVVERGVELGGQALGVGEVDDALHVVRGDDRGDHPVAGPVAPVDRAVAEVGGGTGGRRCRRATTMPVPRAGSKRWRLARAWAKVSAASSAAVCGERVWARNHRRTDAPWRS